jgi:hypothetical protein
MMALCSGCVTESRTLGSVPLAHYVPPRIEIDSVDDLLRQNTGAYLKDVEAKLENLEFTCGRPLKESPGLAPYGCSRYNVGPRGPNVSTCRGDETLNIDLYAGADGRLASYEIRPYCYAYYGT